MEKSRLELNIESLSQHIDAVVMLTWSDWNNELRSNRYHYAMRFAKFFPVIFVQPDLNEGSYQFEEVGIDNFVILHIYGAYDDNQQAQLLNGALNSYKIPIKAPLFWAYNVYLANCFIKMHSPLRVYHATEDYFSEDSYVNCNNDKDLYARFAKVLAATDLLISVSEGVEENYLSKGNYDGDHLIIANGCDYKFYSEGVIQKNSNNKVAIYQGNIFDKLDYDMLFEVATNLPEWAFQFCGKIISEDPEVTLLFDLPNVEYLGLLNPIELREICQQATVGIIPFKNRDYLTKRSLPLKAFEYMACGIPVITTPIDALEKYKNAFIFVENTDEFIRALKGLESNAMDSANFEMRMKLASEQDYDLKFERAINKILEKTKQKKVPNNFFIRVATDVPYKNKISDDKKLKILILYEGKSIFVNTIKEHLQAFSRFSQHKIYYEIASGKNICNVDFSEFDVVLLHYSLRLSLNEGNWTIAPCYAEALRNYTGYSIAMIQDEYDTTDIAKSWLSYLNINAVFSCIPDKEIHKVYPTVEFPKVEFYQNLTGYSSDKLPYKVKIPAMRKRVNKIVYRGRQLPYWYGSLGQEKREIGDSMKLICKERNIQADIETDDSKRIHGKKWYEFLASGRATLGTESGANLFDFDGSVKDGITKMLEQDPNTSYSEANESLLKNYDGFVKMNQISPKIFEAIFLRTALILYEGDYSGVIKPDVHYISLKKNFSNINEVLEKLDDIKFLKNLTDRAYNEIIAQETFSYRDYVSKLDYMLSNKVVATGNFMPEIRRLRYFSLTPKLVWFFSTLDSIIASSFFIKTRVLISFARNEPRSFFNRVLEITHHKIASLPIVGRVYILLAFACRNPRLLIRKIFSGIDNFILSLPVLGRFYGLLSLFVRHPRLFYWKLNKKLSSIPFFGRAYVLFSFGLRHPVLFTRKVVTKIKSV